MRFICFFAFISIGMACNAPMETNPRREKLSAMIDSASKAISCRKNNMYLEIKLENDRLKIPCSKDDSDEVNKRISQLHDSIYSCKMAEDKLDIFWTNNK